MKVWRVQANNGKHVPSMTATGRRANQHQHEQITHHHQSRWPKRSDIDVAGSAPAGRSNVRRVHADVRRPLESLRAHCNCSRKKHRSASQHSRELPRYRFDAFGFIIVQFMVVLRSSVGIRVHSCSVCLRRFQGVGGGCKLHQCEYRASDSTDTDAYSAGIQRSDIIPCWFGGAVYDVVSVTCKTGDS